MSDEEEKVEEGDNRTTLIIALSCAALPLFYFLSLAPMIILVANGYLPSEPLEVIYYPLEWLHKTSPTCRTVIEAYIGLFSGFVP